MGEPVGPHSDAPGRRGRLHGRMLQVLGAVSAVAAAIAVWQFGVFGGAPDRDPVSVFDDDETTSIPDGAEEASATEAVQASSAAIETPTETTAEPTSAAPPSESATPGAPQETTAAVEERTEAAAASCTASLTVKNEWSDSVEVSVEVVNSGSVALASWEIDLDLSDVDIYHHWNMRDLGDGRYGSADWNGRLDPGEDAATGFQAELGDRAELPDSVPCMALT